MKIKKKTKKAIKRNFKASFITILVILGTFTGYASIATLNGGDLLDNAFINSITSLVNTNETKLTNVTDNGAGNGVTINGTVSTELPTLNTHSATKEYVDNTVGAAGASGGGSCYYTDSPICLVGYLMASGKVYQGGGDIGHNICCSGDYTDPCPTKTPGATCTGVSLYAFNYNGSDYMVTPGGCNDSISPVCNGGADTITKLWGSINILTGINNTYDGNVNTIKLSTIYTGTFAAKYCDNMIYDGYNDWFLPSKNELNILYGNKNAIGGFISSFYWSSTESFINNAWYQNFINGNQSNNTKDNSYYVRCIRKL